MAFLNWNSNRLIFYWLPLLVWIGLIFLLSNTTSSTIDRTTTEGPFSMLPRVVANTASSPSFVHPAEFAIMAVLVYRLLASYQGIRLRYVIIGSLLISVGYGFLDEYHQSFVPGRDSSLLDVGLDAIGAFIGVAIAEIIVRANSMIKSRRENVPVN